MINQIFAISIKELKVLLRDRGAMVSLFLLPVAFILVMTIALQGVFDSGSSDNPITLLVVNHDQGDLAGKVLVDLGNVSGLDLVDQQDGLLLTRVEADDLIAAGKYSVALIFPADFSARIHQAVIDPQAAGSTVTFIADPAVGRQLLDPVRGMVQGYVEREASLAQSAQRTAMGFEQMAAQAPANQAFLIRAVGNQFTAHYAGVQDPGGTNLGVTYEVVSPAKYQSVKRPSSSEQNVPGYTIYGVFFIMQTIATGMFREKNDGTFRRLQAAPVHRAVLLTGKMLPYYLINLVQIALMFTVGVLVFQISLGNDPFALALLSLACAAAATGLGLLITTLGKTLEQVSSMSTLLAVLLSVVGGMMVPTYVMPNFMQVVSWVTPHAWALAGFQDVMVRGLGVDAVLPAIGVLLGFSVAFWGIAVRRFRFD
jgi:ABC-2 type transport system permease protein